MGDLEKRYYLSVDLGKLQDYTAISLLEVERRYEKVHDLRVRIWAQYTIRHLERFELATDYPQIVKRVHAMWQNPALHRAEASTLLVDRTGVGIAVMDMMMQDKLQPVGITITGGHTISRDRWGYTVPKKELITSLLVLMQAGVFKVVRSLPLTETLVNELEQFRVKLNSRTGHETYEAWRESEHDDLVLSVAMGAWYAQRETQAFQNQIVDMEQARRMSGYGGSEKKYNPLRDHRRYRDQRG